MLNQEIYPVQKTERFISADFLSQRVKFFFICMYILFVCNLHNSQTFWGWGSGVGGMWLHFLLPSLSVCGLICTCFIFFPFKLHRPFDTKSKHNIHKID